MLRTSASQKMIVACVNLEITTSCQALSTERRLAGSWGQETSTPTARTTDGDDEPSDFPAALRELIRLQPLQLCNQADSSQGSAEKGGDQGPRNTPSPVFSPLGSESPSHCGTEGNVPETGEQDTPTGARHARQPNPAGYSREAWRRTSRLTNNEAKPTGNRSIDTRENPRVFQDPIRHATFLEGAC